MCRIGILGLDSSHPAAFARVLAGMESTTLVGVWDGGAVRGPNAASRFAAEHDTAVVDTPAALVDAVDGVLLLTVNWETHVPLARPFLEADVPVLVDKPLAGSLAAIERLEAVASDTPIFGGSALPYHPTVSAWPRGGSTRQLWLAGYNDPFYYGAHLTATARRLAAANWRSVESTDQAGQTVTIRFENDVAATLRFDGAADPGSFGILDVGSATRTALIDGESASERWSMYESFLRGFLDTVDGTVDETARLLDGARLLLATRAALANDTRIDPSSPALKRVTVDGEAFLSGYEPHSVPTDDPSS